MEDLSRLRPEAVLWHSDKSGGLVKFLRERRSGKPAPSPNVPAPASIAIDEKFVEPSKPHVYTYFAPCKGADALAEQERLLAFWKEAWSANGWEPVVLTEEDAKKHPKFKEWSKSLLAKPTINPKGFEGACWLRHIAMAVDGGFLVDYDVLPFGYSGGIEECGYRLGKKLPNLLCLGVPCAVVGDAGQFENAIKAFIACDPVIESGKLHLSDMHACQKLGFPSIDLCKEWNTPGWETAKLVHFSHAACRPRLRSEVISEALGQRKVNFKQEMKTWEDISSEKMTNIPERGPDWLPKGFTEWKPMGIEDAITVLATECARGGLFKARLVKKLQAAGIVAQPAKKK